LEIAKAVHHAHAHLRKERAFKQQNHEDDENNDEDQEEELVISLKYAEEIQEIIIYWLTSHVMKRDRELMSRLSFSSSFFFFFFSFKYICSNLI
jgi:hypothetical protein